MRPPWRNPARVGARRLTSTDAIFGTPVWSALQRSLANFAPHSTDALAALVKTRLRLMQYRRDDLLDGFIAETGLSLEPP